jgi:hypothetical protein
MNKSANMLALTLGIKWYPEVAEKILTYITPAELGYVVDSLTISNTFPYSNRYFNTIRQLVEDGFTILLISPHFDAPMTRTKHSMAQSTTGTHWIGCTRIPTRSCSPAD